MKKTKNVERELSAEKTEAILTGAMQEFLANGYAATSMDKVATAAGVSKATVYSYFTDKEGLFTALIQQLAQKKEFFNLHQVQSIQEEPAAVLRQVATGMLTNVQQDPQMLTFMRLIVGESGRFPQLAQAFVCNIHKPLVDHLTHYLASRPELQLPDPEVAARVFVGTVVHHVIVQHVLQGGAFLPMERDRLIDGLIGLILAKRQPE